MEGFKILKNPNEPSTANVGARCRKNRKDFSIRLEFIKGQWYMVFASPLEFSSAGKSVLSDSELKLENGLSVGENYSCPYCGDTSIVRCGECGRITCNDGGRYFKCMYCDSEGEISGIITAVNTENQKNAKKK